MKIEYADYARKRLQERQIPEAWVVKIIAQGSRYRDTQSGREIAIGRRHYQGKERDIMVVTSSALKGSQRQRRIQSGRWIPI